MIAEATFPEWFRALSAASLVIAAACAAWICRDEMRRPQTMWIMNLVWPLTTLFGGLLWLAGYVVWGRAPLRGERQGGDDPPFAVQVAKSASHCGAGCTVGDLFAEWLALAFPSLAVAAGWGALFADKMFAVWVLDYAVAFLIGILFQYFAIQPMRHLSPGRALVQAIKADALSITSWQVGMYGAMTLGQLVWFQHAFGGRAPVASPEFWFLMQLAMICGFATSYPVNWLLLRLGVKEAM